MKAKLQQLSGPGIKGLEDCPPCFHVDFEPDEFEQFLSDPQSVLKQLGYDMGHVAINLSRWDDAWSHKKQGWVKVDQDKGIKTKGCCYLSNEVVVCHRHT